MNILINLKTNEDVGNYLVGSKYFHFAQSQGCCLKEDKCQRFWITPNTLPLNITCAYHLHPSLFFQTTCTCTLIACMQFS
jgi:hypothetical protein